MAFLQGFTTVEILMFVTIFGAYLFDFRLNKNFTKRGIKQNGPTD